MNERPTKTVCTLKLHDLEIEIEGIRGVVERLYARVESDLQQLIDLAHIGDEPTERERSIYVYAMDELVAKVYAVPVSEVDARLAGDLVHVRRVSNVYLDGVPTQVAMDVRGNRTLWAHFRTGVHELAGTNRVTEKLDPVEDLPDDAIVADGPTPQRQAQAKPVEPSTPSPGPGAPPVVDAAAVPDDAPRVTPPPNRVRGASASSAHAREAEQKPDRGDGGPGTLKLSALSGEHFPED